MDSELLKALDDWLFKNEKKYAEAIKKKKAIIPDHFKKYTKELYRGMVVDADFLKLVSERKMTFKDITSWSKSEKMALAFIKDKRYKISVKSGVNILITKKIPPSKIILDIHNLVMFTGGIGLDELSVDSAFKEQEILVDKGIKITEKDITVLK